MSDALIEALAQAREELNADADAVLEALAAAGEALDAAGRRAMAELEEARAMIRRGKERAEEALAAFHATLAAQRAVMRRAAETLSDDGSETVERLLNPELVRKYG